MFNATELLKQWNNTTGMKKELKDSFILKQTKEFIETIENEELLNMGNHPYLKTIGKYGGLLCFNFTNIYKINPSDSEQNTHTT